MGKATIVSEQGEGLYTIALDLGQTEIQTKIDEFAARIAELSAQISAKESELLTAEIEVSSLKSSVDSAISVYISNPSDDNLAVVNTRTKELYEAGSKVKAIRRSIVPLRAERGNNQVLRDKFAATVVSVTQSAWCADFTEDATGEVATIEINGEGPEVLIKPGAPAPNPGDGDYLSRLAMDAAATFLNAARLPGWQIHLPTFRAGTVLSIDYENDRADIALEAAFSSEQGININEVATLSDVPIEYLSCNAAAFEVGDAVIVALESRSWDQPKVIGFRTNPRDCGPRRIIIPLELLSVATVTSTPVTTPKSLMRTDVQWTSCVGGQLFVPDEAPRPPGYNFGGQVQSGVTTNIALQADHSTSGVISSPDKYGHFETFTFNEDFRIAGAPAQIHSVIKDGSLATSISANAFSSGFEIRDVTIFENTGALLNDYRGEDRNVGFTTADLEENQDFIDCSTAVLSEYFEGIPTTIDIEAVGGGGTTTFQLYRYFKLESFPDYPGFPSTYGGMCLGYRRAN